MDALLMATGCCFNNDLRANAFRVCRKGNDLTLFPDQALVGLLGSMVALEFGNCAALFARCKIFGAARSHRPGEP